MIKLELLFLKAHCLKRLKETIKKVVYYSNHLLLLLLALLLDHLQIQLLSLAKTVFYMNGILLKDHIKLQVKNNLELSKSLLA